MMKWKRGDLVRVLSHISFRSYDTMLRLRLSEMRKGDLCIIINAEETVVDVFASGRVWSLSKDYFELVK